MATAEFLTILLLAFVMEIIDSGLGMGFGTVLSPLLIAFGYAPTLVVPSILFSQAIGGFTASIFHHRCGNADFKPKVNGVSDLKQKIRENGITHSYRTILSRDSKVMFSITALGVSATITGALVAIKIPVDMLKAYIGILVLIVGALMLTRLNFSFSWAKMMGLSLLASFNKGISGGGFGPLVTGGQIIAGNESKSSIGCTTLSEAPICIVGFIVYLLGKGMSTYDILIPLTIGAFLAGFIGPKVTKQFDGRRIRNIIGVLMMFEGAYTLAGLVMK